MTVKTTATRFAPIVAAARPIALPVPGPVASSGAGGAATMGFRAASSSPGGVIWAAHASERALPSTAMRGWRRSVAVAGAVLALLPGAAAAQSAGDEQYEDPFGNGNQQSQPQATATP